VRFHLRRGAGAYICGEETALLESLEGKRGLPRNKPPFPAQHGYFAKPTLVNNVETLYWVPEILAKGGDWYQNEGRPHFYSVSGRVKSPGVKLAPSGVTVRRLIDDYCGGMADGQIFKAYLPGGASGGILPAAMDDIPLDFGTLEPYGCLVGSAAVVILGEQDSVRDGVLNLLRFFADESCGQCTPCRLGCEKIVDMIEAGPLDRDLVGDLSETMRQASICGLGQAAPNPVMTALDHFADEMT
jgi:formate dehydrogenase